MLTIDKKGLRMLKYLYISFFATSLFGVDYQKMVIFIPSYNNARFYEQNLLSAIRQSYPIDKFRIMYVDDRSTDGTADLVADFINKSDFDKTRFTLIRNDRRKLAMQNFYDNIHAYCDDDEIICVLDGDDQLANNQVLKTLNNAYNKNNIWMTHGSCVFLSTGQKCSWGVPVPKDIIAKNTFRKWNSAPTHLRTFYAWLFKKIKKEDLMMQGFFLPMTYDVAMFMPMLEMAGDRQMFISTVLYIYNDQNPINDHKCYKNLQLGLNYYLRGLQPYTRI